jgi:hypothetical protein
MNSVVSSLKYVYPSFGSREVGYSQISSYLQSLLVAVSAIYGNITLACMFEP